MSKVTIKSGEVKRDPWAGVVFPCVARYKRNGNFSVAREQHGALADYEPVNATYTKDAQKQSALMWDDVTLPWPCVYNGLEYIAITRDEKSPYLLVAMYLDSIVYINAKQATPLPGPITITFEQEDK